MTGRNAIRGQFCLVAAGLICWAVLVRLPFGLAPRSDADAALFWLIGHSWRLGHLPYVTLWDIKPPGTFLIFAGADGLFGADPVGARILAAIAIGVAAAGLYRISERLLDDRRAGLCAALLFPPYTLLLDGLAMKPELFATPLLIWGIQILVRAGPSSALLVVAGALMGAATMLKQTAGFEVLFAFIFLAATRRNARLCSAFISGLILVPAGFMLYFAVNGAFGAFFSASVVGALLRLHGDGVTLAAAPTRVLASLKPALPLLFLTGVGWAERRRIRPSGHKTAPAMIWGWLAAAALGELAMRATYPAYALPLLAPLCLASARTISAMTQAEGRLWRRGAGAVAVLAIFYPIALTLLLPDPDIDPQPPRVAAYLRDHMPNRSVYVVDYDPVVYQLSGAPTPTRFAFPQHLMCDFPALPASPEAELRRIVASHPAALVFAATGHRMFCELPERIGLVKRLAERAGYRRVASIGGATGAVEIWAMSGATWQSAYILSKKGNPPKTVSRKRYSFPHPAMMTFPPCRRVKSNSANLAILYE